MRRNVIGTAVALSLAACLGDPVGPGILVVSVDGAAPDTVWIGAPGEPVPTGVRLRITDDAGRPIPEASLVWEAVGRNAQVLTASSHSNIAGQAIAGWLLGTDANEEQQLHVTVRTSRHHSEIVIRARAIPHVVSQLRLVNDTPAVLRLGDTLSIRVNAIDPYGNVFPAPDVTVSIADSTVGAAVGTSILGGPRRGRSLMRVASHGVTVDLPLHVTQFVAAIVPVSDTIRFTSLGAELLVGYVVRDDRNRVVADTTAATTMFDSTVADVAAGVVRTRSPGVTALRLVLGPAAATVIVDVRQRVATLRMLRDTILFDALSETALLEALVQDSLGHTIPQPALTLGVSDAHVATLEGDGRIRALRQGTALGFIANPETGIADTSLVRVWQAPVAAGISVARRDGFSFGGAGDSIGAVWARDRNGYRLPFSRIQLSYSDSARVYADTGGVLRVLRSGMTRMTALVDSLSETQDLIVVLPVEVIAERIPGFEVAGLPDSLGSWAPTAVEMSAGTTQLFFTGYIPDPIQQPPFSGDLHYATSADGVHFTYVGVALPRDSGYSGYRSQGVESVFILPRDDATGCRMLAAAGSSWWIWQIFSAVAADCTSWTWESGPAVPGVIENDSIGRPIGEGIYVWEDSAGTLWMLTGAYPPTYGEVRAWTIGLYRGSDQRNWQFVRTVIYPGAPGSGRERAVFGPTVAEVAPGLYRMFFTGDDLGLQSDGGRSRIWSAVSNDRFSWVFEGPVLDFLQPTRGPRYPTLIGDRLYYLDYGPGYGNYLSAARIHQP